MLSRSVLTRISMLRLVIRFPLRVFIVNLGSKRNLPLRRVLCHLIVVDRLIPVLNRSNTGLEFWVLASSQVTWRSFYVFYRSILVDHGKISIIIKDTSRFILFLFTQLLGLARPFNAWFSLLNYAIEFSHVFFIAHLAGFHHLLASIAGLSILSVNIIYNFGLFEIGRRLISDSVFNRLPLFKSVIFLFHHLQVAQILEILLHTAFLSGESHKVLAVLVNLVQALVEHTDLFFEAMWFRSLLTRRDLACGEAARWAPIAPAQRLRI